MSYSIVSGQSLPALIDGVREQEERGAKIHGAPFYNYDSRTWCQAVDIPLKSKEVKLREPADTKPKG